MSDHRPSARDVLVGGLQWWCLLTIGFFLTFPLWAPALLPVLRFVLEGLNDIGRG